MASLRNNISIDVEQEYTVPVLDVVDASKFENVSYDISDPVH